MVVTVAGLVVAAVLLVLGLELSSTQSRARRTLTSRFHDRAQIVSALTEAEIASVAASTAAARAYGSATVSPRALDQAVARSGFAYVAVFGHDRQMIAASRNLSPGDRAQVLSSPSLGLVLAGAPVALSDVVRRPVGDNVVELAVLLQSAAGPRVVVGGIPTPILNSFLGAYLERVPTPGGAAYVLDSRRNVVGASTPLVANDQPVADPGLMNALQGRSSGSYGRDGYFVAAPVPHSTWRVVLTSTTSALFSSVSGSRKWLPWFIFIALALVALGFLVLLRRLLISAAALAKVNRQLGTSNARLQSTNELLRRAAELSRSNAELEQFASIASHDLQEPLRKVQTFAAQLMATERERLSPQGQDFLGRMSDTAGRMRALIDDLLMFSRVSKGGRPFTAVNLGDVVSQVLVDLEASVEEAGAQVEVAPMPTVEADPVQMRQLLLNLLANALKFRREGVVPDVQVSGDVVDHIAELTVRDNGIGFDEQYATRIFRAFERLHGVHAYPGTGIGLALCRKIVERHHGTITAEGELGRGATFTVRLPVEQPAETSSEAAPFTETFDDEVPHVHA